MWKRRLVIGLVVCLPAGALCATQAILGGRLLPMQFAVDGQVNAIVPYDVPANTTQQLAIHPVSAGDLLVISWAGLGAVDPPVAAGSATPLAPLSNTVNAVTVTIAVH